MKPVREPDAQSLTKVNGIYFEPIGSNDYVCHKDVIPRDCNGTIAIDLSKDSSITFEWVASDSSPVDKYISLRGAETNTVKFGKANMIHDLDSTVVAAYWILLY
jgi:hypothetical protein